MRKTVCLESAKYKVALTSRSVRRKMPYSGLWHLENARLDEGEP